ncbi:MAG: DUF502 domain-containing protein [Thermodesulfobacteriota bacterium]
MKGIKRYFVTGLLVVVPLYITAYIFVVFAKAMDGLLDFLPWFLNPSNLMPFHLPGMGVIFTVLGILGIGLVTQNFFGRKLVDFGELMLSKIPFLRIIYNASKQFLETFLSWHKDEYSNVVIVQYPRKGVYTLGFVTGSTRGELKERVGVPSKSLFIPTTPNPTSGFYLMVPEADLTPLDMSVEDAFKVIMTGGLVMPDVCILPERKDKAE